MTDGRDDRAMGTPNTVYDLSSVLFHALEGGASYDRFVRDAADAGDRELADFFRRVRDEDGSRANEARRLLAERTFTTTRADGAASGTAPGRELYDGSSGTEETPSKAVERETATTRIPEEDSAPLGEIPPGVSDREVPSSRNEEEDRREKDKDLVHKAKDYLLGEDRERDYLRGEDPER